MTLSKYLILLLLNYFRSRRLVKRWQRLNGNCLMRTPVMNAMSRVLVNTPWHHHDNTGCTLCTALKEIVNIFFCINPSIFQKHILSSPSKLFILLIFLWNIKLFMSCLNFLKPNVYRPCNISINIRLHFVWIVINQVYCVVLCCSSKTKMLGCL